VLHNKKALERGLLFIRIDVLVFSEYLNHRQMFYGFSLLNMPSPLLRMCRMYLDIFFYNRIQIYAHFL